jgi:hypothetical protein
MSKPSTYLVVTYFLTYLPIYETLFCIELVTKVKPNINSVEVHPQPSNNMRLIDGAMVGGCSLWPFLLPSLFDMYLPYSMYLCASGKLGNIKKFTKQWRFPCFHVILTSFSL